MGGRQQERHPELHTLVESSTVGPGEAARAIRAGANLAPDRADGKRTWEEYLAGRI
jgi:hypothetical protein